MKIFEPLLEKLRWRKLTAGITTELKQLFGTDKSISESSQQLKKWLSEMFAEKENDYPSLADSIQEFTTWLESLSEEGLIAFLQKIAHFCTDSRFELVWLIDSNLKSDQEIKKALEETVLLYCIGYCKTTQIQDMLVAYSAFRAWQAAPTTKEHKQLSQVLFMHLVKKELVPEPPPELFLASENERQEHIVSAINKVAEDNMQELNTIIKELESQD